MVAVGLRATEGKRTRVHFATVARRSTATRVFLNAFANGDGRLGQPSLPKEERYFLCTGRTRSALLRLCGESEALTRSRVFSVYC